MSKTNLTPIQDELCDIYDVLGRPTGRTCLRRAPMAAGDFQLGATVWIFNRKNEFLMQQRAMSKRIRPGIWASHGGAVGRKLCRRRTSGGAGGIRAHTRPGKVGIFRQDDHPGTLDKRLLFLPHRCGSLHPNVAKGRGCRCLLDEL